MPVDDAHRHASESLLAGGAAIALPLAGCASSSGDAPRRPVFGYNAGEREHETRVLVDGPGDESDPDGVTHRLEPRETRRLATAEATEFEIDVWLEDGGTRGSTDALAVTAESRSESGYLVTVHEEPVDGEYVHDEVLPDEAD